MCSLWKTTYVKQGLYHQALCWQGKDFSCSTAFLLLCGRGSWRCHRQRLGSGIPDSTQLFQKCACPTPDQEEKVQLCRATNELLTAPGAVITDHRFSKHQSLVHLQLSALLCQFQLCNRNVQKRKSCTPLLLAEEQQGINAVLAAISVCKEERGQHSLFYCWGSVCAPTLTSAVQGTAISRKLAEGCLSGVHVVFSPQCLSNWATPQVKTEKINNLI